MFVQLLDCNHKGAIAEAKIIAAAIELNIPVLAPVAEHSRYDLLFHIEDEFSRVQCKWGRRVGDVIQVQTRSNRYTPAGQIQRVYTAEEIDAVAVYCADLDRCYLLPVGLVAGKHVVHLRLCAPRNNQRAALIWAEEYAFAGAVAQLGERCRGTAEAVGSSPISSTPSTGDSSTVGAHEFRNRFGWYMQRAAAGEEIRVSKRGKPYVRLLAA